MVSKRPSEEELAQNTFDQQPGADQQDDQYNQAPKKQGQGVIEQSLGFSTIPLTAQIARQLGAAEGTTGMVITAVDASSDAGTKGLQRGDIVLTANNQPVATVAQLEGVVRAAKAQGRPAVLLRVQRRGQPATYLPVRVR